VISDILPPEVMAAEFRGDDLVAELMPGEEAYVRNAVESRRREFVTGRASARRALARLGLPAVPILAGPRREPIWPDGVVGSITHCRGYRAAAVARSEDVVAVGIDAEIHDVLPDGVLERIALPEEREWIGDGTGGGSVHWDRLLFSAKESVFKVWYPLMERWLDFNEARLRFTPGAEPSAGRFTARLLVGGPTVDGRRIDEFAGRYLVRDGFALTTVTLLPAQPCAQR
jgi:4'-phosphopantetheinyl transferase EntD